MLLSRPFFPLAIVLSVGCGESPIGDGVGSRGGMAPPATSPVAPSPAVAEAGAAPVTPAPGPADGGSPLDATAPPEDLCPTLPIPATCRGRSVIYREYGPTAVGDGTYFADQAPMRLGFNRIPDAIWVVKFRTEANTYFGRVAAYGDNTGGLAYIARDPCDPSTAVADKTVIWGNHGGGSIDFIVTANAADGAALRSQPTTKTTPQLKGGACYYAVFQNAATFPSAPIDVAYINSVPDDCGEFTGMNNCYYLAFDMMHRLHTDTGQLIAGAVIPGFTK